MSPLALEGVLVCPSKPIDLTYRLRETFLAPFSLQQRIAEVADIPGRSLARAKLSCLPGKVTAGVIVAHGRLRPQAQGLAESDGLTVDTATVTGQGRPAVRVTVRSTVRRRVMTAARYCVSVTGA